MEPKEATLVRSDVHDIPVEVLEEVLSDPIRTRLNAELIRSLIQHLAPVDTSAGGHAVAAPALANSLG